MPTRLYLGLARLLLALSEAALSRGDLDDAERYLDLSDAAMEMALAPPLAAFATA